MSCPVTQRSPKGAWRTVWELDWWIFTSIPFGEEYKTWVKVRHPINLHKVRPARVQDVTALSLVLPMHAALRPVDLPSMYLYCPTGLSWVRG